jgi:hypothetical protein
MHRREATSDPHRTVFSVPGGRPTRPFGVDHGLSESGSLSHVISMVWALRSLAARFPIVGNRTLEHLGARDSG